MIFDEEERSIETHRESTRSPGDYMFLLPPRPVIRERVGVRVIWSDERFLRFKITLILTFSRITGRRDRRKKTSLIAVE
jgi:hypothetical protein